MKTIKTILHTLIITMFFLLSTSCTDQTDDLVPETKTQHTELTTGVQGYPGNLPDTGDGDGNGNGDGDGGKQN